VGVDYSKTIQRHQKTQALSVTGTLAMFTAIFLHDSLELFLTGRDYAFKNLKGVNPNVEVGKNHKKKKKKKREKKRGFIR